VPVLPLPPLYEGAHAVNAIHLDATTILADGEVFLTVYNPLRIQTRTQSRMIPQRTRLLNPTNIAATPAGARLSLL
jgi:hypothetical protein